MKTAYYIIGLLTALYVSNAGSAEPVWTTLQISKESTVSVRIERYDPPLHFEHGTITRPDRAPAWYKAYYAFNHPGEFAYAEWKQYLMKGYVDENKLDEKLFAEHSKNFSREKHTAARATALYATFVRFDGREMCLVTFYEDGHLERSDSDLRNLKYPPCYIPFEFSDGRWRIQSPRTMDQIKSLPKTNLAEMEALLRRGRQSEAKTDRTAY